MKFRKFFTKSSGILLIFTALAKLFSIIGSARILMEQDPITGLRFRYLLFIVALVELVVGLTCFFSKHAWFSMGLITWLATVFLAYRIVLKLVGYHKPCNCFGNFTDSIHVSPQIADTASQIILAYLLVGGYVTLFRLWWPHKKIPSSIAVQ